MWLHHFLFNVKLCIKNIYFGTLLSVFLLNKIGILLLQLLLSEHFTKSYVCHNLYFFCHSIEQLIARFFFLIKTKITNFIFLFLRPFRPCLFFEWSGEVGTNWQKCRRCTLAAWNDDPLCRQVFSCRTHVCRIRQFKSKKRACFTLFLGAELYTVSTEKSSNYSLINFPMVRPASL